MNAEQAWQSVLGQLQMEMPRSSFETWVRDSQVVSYDSGVMTIGVRDRYTAEWLESRLLSTVSRLLVGMLDQSVDVRFVVSEPVSWNEQIEETELDEVASPEDAERQDAIARKVYAVKYDKIVQPNKRIVVDGYLARLIPEIGSPLGWLYIGCHQGAWMNGGVVGGFRVRLPVPLICRYTGLSMSSAKRLLYNDETWAKLAGILERPEQEKQWEENKKRPWQKKRVAIEYIVHMTLPLSWSDALAIKVWLTKHMQGDVPLLNAMVEALQVKELVGEILLPIEDQPNLAEVREALPNRPLYIIDIARELLGLDDIADVPSDIQQVADALHTRIIKAFGTIGITHYFVETVIPEADLTPDLAMAITLLRSRTYVNEKTGEVRNEVLVRGGHREIAAWLGIKRTRKIWEMFTGRVDKKTLDKNATWDDPKFATRRTLTGVGPGPAFIAQLPAKDDDFPSWKRFTVRLLEPLLDDGSEPIGNDGSGPIVDDGSGLIRHDGSEPNKSDGSEPILGVGSGPIRNDGSGPDSWRKWDGINDSMTLVQSLKSVRAASTSITERKATKKGLPLVWDLETLLDANKAYRSNKTILLSKKVFGKQFVSWTLYYFGVGQVDQGMDPMSLVMKALLDDPSSCPGDAYDRLAEMPPHVLLDTINLAIKYGHQETGIDDWDRTMKNLSSETLLELQNMLDQHNGNK